MNHCKTDYQGAPVFLARDEQAQVALLCSHVLAGDSDQVLVSGISGARMHMVGSKEIGSRLRKDWSIEALDDPTEERLISFLERFALDVRGNRTGHRIRFAATAPQYLSGFLAELAVPCRLGLYIMGFDARSQERYTKEFVELLRSWRRRVKGAEYHLEGIVEAGDNNFLIDTQLELMRALDAGHRPTDLFLAALEMRDG